MFADIQNHWAKSAITQLADLRLIRGYPDGKFRPDGTINRAEFAALLQTVFPSVPLTRSGISFSDVPDSHWAHQAIQFAYRTGFLSGYPDRSFRPKQSIPKVQVLVALAAGLKAAIPSDPIAVLTEHLDDGSQIPKYAMNAIAAAIQARWMVNYPQVRRFNPNQNASRGEVSAVLTQVLTQAWQVPALPQFVAGNPVSKPRKASFGIVEVELTPYQKQLRLKITRQGKVLQDELISEVQSSVWIQDLDKDGELEVILDSFQPQQGFSSKIYHYQGETRQYRSMIQNWGMIAYRYQDLNQDGKVEFISGNSAFGIFANNSLDSALPLQVWRYENKALVEVTSLSNTLLQRHAEQLWQEVLLRRSQQRPIQGMAVAFWANKIRLKESKSALQEISRIGLSQDVTFFQTAIETLAETGYFPPQFAIPPNWMELTAFSESDRTISSPPLAQFQQNNQWGYLDPTGKVVIPAQYIGTSRLEQGLAWVRNGNQYGYINPQGNSVIPSQFDSIIHPFSEGLLPVAVGDKYGYVDTTGKMVIPPQFDEAQPFYDLENNPLNLKLAVVRRGELYGYINPTGNWVIAAQFEGADPFKGGFARVWIGEKVGYIDPTGKFLLSPQFDWADSFAEGLARVYLNQKWGVINLQGNFTIPLKFDYLLPFSGQLARMRVEQKWGFVNRIGDVTITPKFDGLDDFQAGIARAKSGEKYGYINEYGNWLINPQFEWGDRWSEGLALVQLDGKFGYIDRAGKMVISPQFESASAFSQDLAAVKVKNQWGYLYRTGKMLIPPQFEAADPFLNSLARVNQRGKWGYLKHPFN